MKKILRFRTIDKWNVCESEPIRAAYFFLSDRTNYLLAVEQESKRKHIWEARFYGEKVKIEATLKEVENPDVIVTCIIAGEKSKVYVKCEKQVFIGYNKSKKKEIPEQSTEDWWKEQMAFQPKRSKK